MINEFGLSIYKQTIISEFGLSVYKHFIKHIDLNDISWSDTWLIHISDQCMYINHNMTWFSPCRFNIVKNCISGQYTYIKQIKQNSSNNWPWVITISMKK